MHPEIYTALKRYTIAFLVMTLLLVCAVCVIKAQAEVISDTDAVKAILGEASNQGYQGMLAVAVGIRNRGTLKGVYGLKAAHIYKEPKYIWDMAKKAWIESRTLLIHPGTHWENIKAYGKPYWIKNMTLVYQYKDHNFYK